MKKLTILVCLLMAACNAQQVADTQKKADALAANLSNVAQVGCALDGKFVPIGQDAAAIIAPVVGATNAAAGTLLMAAVGADKALVHPTVVAVCKSLLGDRAAPAVQVVPSVTVPAASSPVADAAPVAVKPGA